MKTMHKKTTSTKETSAPELQSSKKATLLWIDLEMTGLVPGKDRILEVAAIGTDWDLSPIAEYRSAVKVDDDLIKQRMVGEFWEKNSAARTGLVRQNATAPDGKIVEQELIAFLDQYFAEQSITTDPRGRGKIILAGNSIHQDRKFIDIEWPELARRLHYRMLDVSAWKVYFEGAKNIHFAKPDAHRALDDILGSIDELRYYSKFLKGEN